MMKYDAHRFLLSCPTAQDLYWNYAKDQPIFDYHCHLSPQEIWEDEAFPDIGQLWLGGDHYKWRVMRLAGLPEELITGSASWKEKFCAFAQVLETLCGCPVYHWAQMELAAYFDITEPLTKENASGIYEKANAIIRERRYSPRSMIRQARVKLVGTTDDPADSLEFHEKLASAADFDCKVVPTFRPDLALMPNWQGFDGWIVRMDALGLKIRSYPQLLLALENRMEYFIKRGALSSDHSVEVAGDFLCFSPEQADEVLRKALSGQALSKEEQRGYFWRLLTDLAVLYQRHGLVMQLHIGALRSVNGQYRQRVGANTGFDVMDDYLVARQVNRLLNQAQQEGGLPKTILYPLNGQQFQVLAAAAASFPKEGTRGHVQLGSAWWHNDHKEGIEGQLLAIAQQGLLPYFVGMLTDSRSFLSYARHDYFRRVLCSFIGERMDKGEFLAGPEKAGKLVANLCYGNAKAFFSL